MRLNSIDNDLSDQFVGGVAQANRPEIFHERGIRAFRDQERKGSVDLIKFWHQRTLYGRIGQFFLPQDSSIFGRTGDEDH